jgi:hypothetical protein
MDSLLVGFIKWQDNRPADHRMGLVIENFQPPKRQELGDLDKEEWETDDGGEPRDPWQFSNYLVMADPESREVFTFTTSSRGGLGAIGELCKVFGKQMRQQPDKIPVVELDVGSYQHREKSYGRIKYPIFKIAGWADRAPFAELLGSSNGDGGDGDAEQIPF